jgi:hypothetical protein
LTGCVRKLSETGRKRSVASRTSRQVSTEPSVRSRLPSVPASGFRRRVSLPARSVIDPSSMPPLRLAALARPSMVL